MDVHYGLRAMVTLPFEVLAKSFWPLVSLKLIVRRRFLRPVRKEASKLQKSR